MAGAQSRQQIRWPQGKKATALSLSRQILHINVSLRWKYSSLILCVSVRSHLELDSRCYDFVLNNIIRYFLNDNVYDIDLNIHKRIYKWYYITFLISSDKMNKCLVLTFRDVYEIILFHTHHDGIGPSLLPIKAENKIIFSK